MNIGSKKILLNPAQMQGKIIEIRTKTPYTIGGLCEHLGVHPKYFDDYIETLENMDDKEKSKKIYPK